MQIRDWMAKNVFTVKEDTSLLHVTKLMTENKIRRLPVVDNEKLVGIITDRDVKDASPAKTTTLDVHELYYLFSGVTVKDIMTPNPIVLSGDDSLEKAAVLMLETKISGIPVTDEKNNLIGLLSETDVLRGFIHTSGIKDGTMQYIFDLTDATGAVSDVISTLKDNNMRVISMTTSFEDTPKGVKRVSMRVISDGKGDYDALSTYLYNNYNVVFSARDELKNLPHK
jgi:acetoin utilization protein AcuB